MVMAMDEDRYNPPEPLQRDTPPAAPVVKTADQLQKEAVVNEIKSYKGLQLPWLKIGIAGLVLTVLSALLRTPVFFFVFVFGVVALVAYQFFQQYVRNADE